MADDKKKSDNDEEGTTEPSSGKKKLIILAVVAIVLVGLSIGGTLMALKVLSPEPVATEIENGGEDAGEESEIEVVKESAIYYPLKPAIIVNFPVRGRQRYLQAELTLMTRETDVIEAIELHMPMIRNALVLQFGGQVYADLQTAEGKELLRQQALEKIQNILQQEIDKPGIEQVLFTNFVMQ